MNGKGRKSMTFFLDGTVVVAAAAADITNNKHKTMLLLSFNHHFHCQQFCRAEGEVKKA